MKTDAEPNASERPRPALPRTSRPRAPARARDEWTWAIQHDLPGFLLRRTGGRGIKSLVAAPYLLHRHD